MGGKHTGQLFSDSLFCICKKETGAGNLIFPDLCFYSADTDLAPEMK